MCFLNEFGSIEQRMCFKFVVSLFEMNSFAHCSIYVAHYWSVVEESSLLESPSLIYGRENYGFRNMFVSDLIEVVSPMKNGKILNKVDGFILHQL